MNINSDEAKTVEDLVSGHNKSSMDKLFKQEVPDLEYFLKTCTWQCYKNGISKGSASFCDNGKGKDYAGNFTYKLDVNAGKMTQTNSYGDWLNYFVYTKNGLYIQTITPNDEDEYVYRLSN